MQPIPEASWVLIDSTLQGSDSLEAFIRPYREHVNQVLDSTLSYAPANLTKTDGTWNSSLGNLMADIVHTMTDSLTGLQGKAAIDFVLLNHGGIRSILSAGPVSERTAYELMPFENTIFIAELDGGTVAEMLDFLRQAGVPHPISGMQITLDAAGRVSRVRIGGLPFDPDRTYRVATSSYLIAGGDGMDFFSEARHKEDTGYKIRNALVDYFKSRDTLRSDVDARFIQVPGS